jgi:hypothetical protein
MNLETEKPADPNLDWLLGDLLSSDSALVAFAKHRLEGKSIQVAKVMTLCETLKWEVPREVMEKA